MASRLELQSKLEELLGIRNVYYQPPESIKINYPAIVYERDNIRTNTANNKTYIVSPRYSIKVIDRKPDNEVIRKLLELPTCTFDRGFKSDNLYHDILTLYY